MREKAELGQPTFALTADVSEAHRQVPIHPSDWRFLGCQISKGSSVYVNTVGTFGITSASYYWNRVGAAIGRVSQYVVGRQAATWHMLVADDYHLEAGGKEYRFALIAFFVVCSIVGVPLSWNKTSGGETVTWVGFELLHRTRQFGISQRRADWFRKWTTEVASSSSLHMASFEEGLGRVMYVAGAPEYERPFLGPRNNTSARPTAKMFPSSGGTTMIFIVDGTDAVSSLVVRSQTSENMFVPIGQHNSGVQILCGCKYNGP